MPKTRADLKRFGFENVQVTDLTDAQRAQLLGVRKTATVLALTPGRPRTGDCDLTLYAPLFVVTGKRGDEGAYFAGAHFDIRPGVRIDFVPVKADQSHLVEFSVGLGNEGEEYRFRLSQLGKGSFDVTIRDSQVLTMKVVALSGDTSLMAKLELVSSGPDKPWRFCRARVTVAAG